MKRVRATDRICFVVLALIAMSNGTWAAERPRQMAVNEQSVFSEQYPIQKPVVLSPAVLKVLMKNKEVKDGLDFATDAERLDRAQLFRATEVHLSGAGEVDLVVAGVGRMSGADNDWYWVVRSSRTHPRVVLFAGCNALELMRSRTNGYRNLHTSWWSPSEAVNRFYHFDGARYRLAKEKWSENRH